MFCVCFSRSKNPTHVHPAFRDADSLIGRKIAIEKCSHEIDAFVCVTLCVCVFVCVCVCVRVRVRMTECDQRAAIANSWIWRNFFDRELFLPGK